MILEIIKKSQSRHDCIFQKEIWELLKSSNGYLRQSAAKTLMILKEPSGLYKEMIIKFDNYTGSNWIHSLLLITLDISKESTNPLDSDFLFKIQKLSHSRIDLLKNIIYQISENMRNHALLLKTR